MFDIRQGVAIALFVKNKKAREPKVFHLDRYGLREEKYEWLDKNEFNKKNYNEIKPTSPWYFLIPRHTKKIKYYLEWKSITEIFPVNNMGIKTHRDNLVIDFNKNSLKSKILQLRNSSVTDEILLEAFNLKNTPSWNIKKARKKISSDDNWDEYFEDITYRPFDIRNVYYSDSLIDRPRREIMRHMLKENNCLVIGRQGQVVGLEHLWNLIFISENIIDTNIYYRGGGLLLPLYIYPNKNKKDIFNQHQTVKEPNIPQILFEKLSSHYGQKPTPEDILYYIYGVFYSNIYRETYAEFLKIDFPRVPFTVDYYLFKNMGGLGKELADLHLLKSPALNPPVAKFQGSGENDRIEKLIYQEDEQRIYINKDKYFEGIAPEVWNYHIGGYQVLHKYLKDRKGRIMDDAPRYCRIVTALSKTIKIQEKIDKIYPEIEKDLIDF